MLEKIDDGELTALAPDRLRQLRGIAADWSRRGEMYLARKV